MLKAHSKLIAAYDERRTKMPGRKALNDDEDDDERRRRVTGADYIRIFILRTRFIQYDSLSNKFWKISRQEYHQHHLGLVASY